MHAQLEPPSYEDCTLPGPSSLTLDIKDTKIYTPCTNHARKLTHYRTTSNLNRDFVKGGFGLFRVNPYKPSERIEVFDVRAVGDASFRITGVERGACRVMTVNRKFRLLGHSWEVRELVMGSDLRRMDEGRMEMKLTAKRTSKEDGTLRWCDANGKLIATDTKLVRRRGNHENHFQMPVLSIVAEVEEELLDILVAAWLARVWAEVVQAKKKTLMDAA
jgi:hypothetical protein